MSAAAGYRTVRPFTDEQWQMLLQMHADGHSWTEIGAAIGHTANSCSTTFSARKRTLRKGSHRPWIEKDVAELMHKRDALRMEFKDIARDLGRTVSACESKYKTFQEGPNPHHGQPELGMRVSVTPAALADRDARYQAWLQQPAAAALMGDPLPGRSALDMRGKQQ